MKSIERHALRVHTQPCAVLLHDPPQDKFRGLVDIGPAGVIGEVPLEGYLEFSSNDQLLFEEITSSIRLKRREASGEGDAKRQGRYGEQRISPHE